MILQEDIEEEIDEGGNDEAEEEEEKEDKDMKNEDQNGKKFSRFDPSKVCMDVKLEHLKIIPINFRSCM